MKLKVKMAMALILIVICANILSAETISTGTNAVEKPLTLNEKIFNYSQLRYSPNTPVMAACAFGFGSGSFMQSDYISGTIGLVADLVGIALCAGGYALSTSSYGFVSFADSSGPLVLSGALALVCSRVFQVVMPTIAADMKNNRLKMQLGLTIPLD